MDVRDYFDFIDETSIRIKGYRVYIDEVLEQRLQGKDTEHLQAGGHVSGILCFPQRTSIGTYIKELRRIWESFTPEHYQDVIQYLPQNKR